MTPPGTPAKSEREALLTDRAAAGGRTPPTAGKKSVPSVESPPRGTLPAVPADGEVGDGGGHKLPHHGASLPTPPPHGAAAEALRLIFGAGGIYAAFLYYGSLQEDVFNHTSADHTQRFTQVWFLQFLEASANVLVGFAGLKLVGGTPGIPKKFFAISGASQVAAKAFTSSALASGLSFPVATLAKSGKMAPVMAGQLAYGGAKYSVREYCQVAAIIGGTAVLSLGKKKGGKSQSTPLGLLFILLSLTMDGVTAGVQKRLKADLGKVGVHPKPYDFMFWTNLYMAAVAAVLALLLGEFASGMAYCASNPEIWNLVVKFSVCSAVGQSFIFYTVAHFDPLVCSTVTTTRKIFSVLLSIFTKGHRLTGQGWAGVGLAVSGILSEVQGKFAASRSRHLKSKVSFPLFPSQHSKPVKKGNNNDDGGMRHRLPVSSFGEEEEDELLEGGARGRNGA